MQRHFTQLWKYPAALLCVAALLAPSAAHAQVAATITGQSEQVAMPGDTITFTGTITNTSTTDNYTLTSGSLGTFTSDPSNGNGVFLSGIGYPVDPDTGSTLFTSGSGGDTYTGDLFSVSLDPTMTPPGVYSGTFEVNGYDSAGPNADPNQTPVALTTVDFTFTVAPEPGAPAAFGVALLGLAGLAARRRLARA